MNDDDYDGDDDYGGGDHDYDGNGDYNGADGDDDLHINIWREFHGVVIVESDHLFGRSVCVNVAPSVP